MSFLEIAVVILIIVCGVNIWLTLFVQNKKEENSALSVDDIKRIEETVSSSMTKLNEIISSNLNSQNKIYMEQVENKIGEVKKLVDEIATKNNDFQLKLTKDNADSFDKLNKRIQENQEKNSNALVSEFKSINSLIAENNEKSTKQISNKFDEFAKIIKEKMDSIDKSVATNLDNIRKDNNEKLDKIQGVVDEKLQKTLEERLSNSFKNVIEQIGGVNKAIGEIKGLATDVSSLKNVLANVKTKGIVGEVILGNLIREILVPG